MIKGLLVWGAVAGLWGLVAVGGLFAWHAYQLPDITDLDRYSRPGSVRLMEAGGSLLASYGPLHGDPVTVADLPPHVPDAVIAIEDRRFYDHVGLDVLGLARAMVANLRAGRVVQGGSTLTQQLAKNIFLTPDRSLSRKIQELLLAFWLERTFGKDEILAIYLNRVYFGAGAYGIDAAARKYFGKSATQLSLAESAMLAGMLKGPSRYNPVSAPERARQRADLVLAAMAAQGRIGETARRQATTSPARVRGSAGRGPGHRWFADWVHDQVPSYTGRRDADLSVRTTLDTHLQRLAEQAVAQGFAKTKGQNVGQVALVALDPATGAVRAMVGGRDYRTSQFNRAVQARRQPGSAIKPIVFLAALDAGWAPDDIIGDDPITVEGWSPANIDGRFLGAITLTEALSQSRNAASVRLQERIGRQRVRALAGRLGLGMDLAPGPSLVLGVDTMSPLDLAGVYAAFANGGRPIVPYAIEAIVTRAGNPLFTRSGSGLGGRVDPDAVGALNAMLAEAIDGGTGKAARLDRPAAGKTGTSQGFRDAWFAGYTADLVAVVWVGNDDGRPMNKVTGGGLPARIWRDFMTAAHVGKPAHPLPGVPLGDRLAHRAAD
ncbi:MAG: PBP1A family penicillin-binding protein [Alphaproteobacteria bacterium]|nr:PBP1A family penicillin-binding protein [Alphaproteobacteria bacterium]